MLPIDGASTTNPIVRIEPLDAASSVQEPLEGGPVGPAFGDVLNSLIRQTDGAQQNADHMVEALAMGEPVDVQQVMLAINEASDALHLTLQVRNKVLDAYNEIMRMPM